MKSEYLYDLLVPGVQAGEKETSADRAYREICRAIQAGAIKPGDKLKRREMAKLAGVSIIPVIEAIHRLEEQGLAESAPHAGTVLLKPDAARYQEKMILREAVECEAAYLLAPNLTQDQYLWLAEAAGTLDRLQHDENPIQKEYKDRHYRFHLQIAQYTGVQSLITTLHRLNLFHILIVSEDETQASQSAIPADNHGQLVFALKTGNSRIAQEAMRDHLRRSALFPNGI